MGRRFGTARVVIAAVLALAALALPAAPAQAVFHLMKIREVYTGSPSDSNSQFVELQMYAFGQNLVQGHSVHFYAASGSNTPTETFAANVPNGANQSTILIATAQAEAEFGVQADLEMPPKATTDFNPAGGAVCFENIDCVSWGSFSGAPMSPTGTPASAIPAGSSLERSIAPNCPTLLESGDDTNNSLIDFGLAAPSPRNNATTPTEMECTGGSGGPDTQITKAPKNKTKKRKVTYEFISSSPGATFQCSANGKPFDPCTSPHTFRGKKGKNEFEVRAVDAAGNVDQTPAEDKFKVKKKRKK
jgi:hypothetical protein